MEEKKSTPGVCVPWEEKKKEYLHIKGDEQIVKRWWEEFDTLAYIYIWFVVIAL